MADVPFTVTIDRASLALADLVLTGSSTTTTSGLVLAAFTEPLRGVRCPVLDRCHAYVDAQA